MRWAEQGRALHPVSDEASGMLSLLYGTALMYVGDPRKACRELQRFVALARDTDKLKKLVPDGLFNLAYVMRFLRRVDDERRLLEEATAAFAERGRFHQVVETHLHLAWSELQRGAVQDAEVSLERADALLSDHGDAALYVKRHLCEALACHLRSQIQESSKICERLLADPALTPSHEADVTWMLGRNALATGDIAAAEKWVDRSYACALQDWWPIQLAYIEELRLRVASSKVGR